LTPDLLQSSGLPSSDAIHRNTVGHGLAGASNRAVKDRVRRPLLQPERRGFTTVMCAQGVVQATINCCTIQFTESS
jgi:hypothetical protein